MCRFSLANRRYMEWPISAVDRCVLQWLFPMYLKWLLLPKFALTHSQALCHTCLYKTIFLACLSVCVGEAWHVIMLHNTFAALYQFSSKSCIVWHVIQHETYYNYRHYYKKSRFVNEYCYYNIYDTILNLSYNCYYTAC